MDRVGDDGWDPTREHAWNEAEAIRLLQNAGELVAGFETTGARMPQRERYHARLVAAHDARDMDAYWDVLNGYVAAARQADYEAKWKEQTVRRNEAASQREGLEEAGWESEKTEVGELVWRDPESGYLHPQNVALGIGKRRIAGSPEGKEGGSKGVGGSCTAGPR